MTVVTYQNMMKTRERERETEREREREEGERYLTETSIWRRPLMMGLFLWCYNLNLCKRLNLCIINMIRFVLFQFEII